jgi:hypothetical protein
MMVRRTFVFNGRSPPTADRAPSPATDIFKSLIGHRVHDSLTKHLLARTDVL